ncbi:6-hydroxymethylpterin diphosphokinase MptE-like protein [uncultured Neptuniibacter sp.]|uniref:motility associated factor glycosyltransferase family protein n=1 Tax=uncultured Neptuniibacter sp. TaxID=502143 RepID=UPI0026158588|nr:6-hydroxymethylpterin diphosphokinase MptE-like protein [uncultured Neptuniibacter sp.]
MQTSSGLDVLLSRLDSKNQAGQIFSKNLEFLKTKSPDLFERVSKYKPTRLIPAFDGNGDINIQNSGGRFVYPESPITYAKKQVNEFLNDTKCRLIRYQDASVVKQEGYIHQQMMESMFDLYPDGEKGATAPNKDNILQMVVVCGIGSGLHIDLLLKAKPVRNLVIYDTDLAGFFASMFFVDWSTLLKSVKGSIEVIIEKDINTAIARLNSFLSKYGYFNLSKYYVYYHYENPDIKEFVKTLKERILKAVSGFGFYDDERVGLAHTLQNIAGGYGISRMALNDAANRNQYPVFVLGNGPSLDESIDYIRENRQGCILISCGSATGTLQNIGIKPDIHIEQERPLSTYDWLRNSTASEFREGIYFVGLNTVYPKCFELFDKDKSFISIKPNDLGMVYVKNALKMVEGNTLCVADGCNPTVTNFGVALAVTLGFENIYLAGVDCGMKNLDSHHASQSKFQQSEDKNEYAKQGYIQSGVFRVRGTQSKYVYTTSTLNNTRLEIERLIEKYHLKLTNLGSGAFINGANNIKAGQLEALESIQSGDILNDIFPRVFHRRELEFEDPETIRTQVCAEMKELNNRMLSVFTASQITSEADLCTTLRTVNDTFKQADISEYTQWYMRGSMEYLMAVISSIYAYNDQQNYAEVGTRVKQIMATFFESQYVDLKDKFYDLDLYTTY